MEAVLSPPPLPRAGVGRGVARSGGQPPGDTVAPVWPRHITRYQECEVACNENRTNTEIHRRLKHITSYKRGLEDRGPKVSRRTNMTGRYFHRTYWKILTSYLLEYTFVVPSVERSLIYRIAAVHMIDGPSFRSMRRA